MINSNETILITGGAGYIGSHTCVELLKTGRNVVIADDLSNSKAAAVARIAKIAGREPVFIRANVRDEAALGAIFAAHHIDAVIHFAGYKAVGESVKKPLKYYENNLVCTMSLLAAMARANVKRLVFSSSATVYGPDNPIPYVENMPLSATSPYGRTKLMIEQMLRDMHAADHSLSIALLRYFNPVGAHESGLIGEDPHGIPNNLMPYISQVAVGRLARLGVFGGDYPTRDGTGVRDYIHVCDLAEGHVCALQYLFAHEGAFEAINLGSGRGSSVLEVVAAFAEASGRPIPYEIQARRPGDIAEYYADASRAKALLGWQTKRSLLTMCADSWRWQSMNPNGYEE